MIMDTSNPLPIKAQDLIAIDLGSNSFHLLVSRWQNGELEFLERNKQVVQLARGIEEDNQLCPAAKNRALTCLREFSLIIQRYPNAQIYAVGTQALRMASKVTGFLKDAQAALGAPIEIINGETEAQLSYQGINFFSDNTQNKSKQLVIDIGGASTEFVVGEGCSIHRLTSLELGCVVLADQCFTDSPGPVKAEQFEAAYQHSCTKLRPLAADYNANNWQVCIGASGTMGVIAELTENPAIINRRDLNKLIEEMLEAGEIKGEHEENLKHDVLPAGIAMLQAIFDQLNIDELQVSQATLKEGLMVRMLENTEKC